LAIIGFKLSVLYYAKWDINMIVERNFWPTLNQGIICERQSHRKISRNWRRI